MKKLLLSGVSLGLCRGACHVHRLGRYPSRRRRDPLPGQYASFGEQMKRGAEMAVADINAAGGVNGEQLVLKSVTTPATRSRPSRSPTRSSPRA